MAHRIVLEQLEHFVDVASVAVDAVGTVGLVEEDVPGMPDRGLLDRDVLVGIAVLVDLHVVELVADTALAAVDAFVAAQREEEPVGIGPVDVPGILVEDGPGTEVPGIGHIGQFVDGNSSWLEVEGLADPFLD